MEMYYRKNTYIDNFVTPSRIQVQPSLLTSDLHIYFACSLKQGHLAFDYHYFSMVPIGPIHPLQSHPHPFIYTGCPNKHGN